MAAPGAKAKAHLDKLAEKYRLLSEQEITVGFPEGKQKAYPDGTSVVAVAAANCFGTKNIPMRNFMGYAALDIRKRCGPILKAMAELEAGKVGQMPKLQNAAGLLAENSIKQAIIDLRDPPNAPSTIARKGSSNPLIDTGHMKSAVTYIIRKKRP